ncbi:MAG: class I SAM-dependent methyltransferase [Planctomycetaceae bacterium]|nr:class I SAM-dependent methyltransferase [Planctomycetaceae bacterium]
MFKREKKTFEFAPNLLQNIMSDSANPLKRIVEIIPDGSTVLDIGAGSGILGMLLKMHRKNIIIDGIEPDEYAASLAQSSYRFFYNGFAEQFIDKIKNQSYDYIIMADVVEHLNDPFTFINKLREGTEPKTKFIFSIPNVAFGSVRISLLNGEFNYVDSGLLERTHLRFFTLKTIESLVKKLDMHIELLNFLQRDFYTTEIPIQNNISNLPALMKIYKDRLASTYQFLLVLTKSKVNTKKEYYGRPAFNPILSYVKLPQMLSKLKKMAKWSLSK